MDTTYSMINFYNELKLKYKDYLKPEIISIVMIQSKDDVYLETTEVEIVETGLEKYTVKRINLDFITDSDEDEGEEEIYFDLKDSIENNVKKFIDDFSPYSIVNTTDIFHEEACEKIATKYKAFGIDG
ncbi:MAG: hypothetical protein ACTHWU_11325 [Senegalia sp. (in: firmicutes)]|uniref:hypothetical protein n=1 Tax=Senegalia sp. (in: firmicutes) TaxID=1924098 RepID=UPI003F9843F5